MRGFFSLYSWRFPELIVELLQHRAYRIRPYVKTFWGMNNFAQLRETEPLHLTRPAKMLLVVMRVGMSLQLIAGFWLIVEWHWHAWAGGLAFGLALILGNPVVWAHLIIPFVLLGYLLQPKRLGRAIVCQMLEQQVKRLRARHQFKVVAVVGSVGKTSTKMAIAKTLAASRTVVWQEGNYNDRVTVPLIFFERALPSLLNFAAWTKIFIFNERVIRRAKYPYDVVVIELGTDEPGDIAEFAYTQPDILVVTAVTPEHMEYFGTLDAVAHEELTAFDYAAQTLVNTDDVPARYLENRTYKSFGLQTGDYFADSIKAKGSEGQEITFHLDDKTALTVTISLLGDQGAKVALAAAATAHALKLKPAQIEKGLAQVEAFAGRMRLLKGIKNATIIDDSYNSSPVAAKAALDVLYKMNGPQRIAVLGAMNELGGYSPEAHQEIAEYCDPQKLDMVLTLGPDANKYLLPVAKGRGCITKKFTSPYALGEYVKKHLKDDAVVLVKGSQNRVFAEEAIKPLLADSNDQALLVRQSSSWMRVKRSQFSDAPM